MTVSICVLGSGSKGNCTAVWNEKTLLLIDAGRFAVRYIRDSLATAGLKTSAVDAVLVTHCHTDHLSDTTYRLCTPDHIPVYCSKDTWQAALKRRSNRRLEEIEKRGLLREMEHDEFRVGEFTIRPFGVSHSHRLSAGKPVGFTLLADGVKVAYTTDLGHATREVEEELAGSDILVVESNHDVEMELNSGRHPDTIRWVLGDTGHLSNEQCAGLLTSVISLDAPQPQHIILAHLSQECNQPELALKTARSAVRTAGSTTVHLIAAAQRNPTPVLSIPG